MKAIIFDTETTGTDAPEIVEAAWELWVAWLLRQQDIDPYLRKALT